jgi:hypothetical protein
MTRRGAFLICGLDGVSHGDLPCCPAADDGHDLIIIPLQPERE